MTASTENWGTPLCDECFDKLSPPKASGFGLVELFVVLGILGIALLIGAVAYEDFKHPCVRSHKVQGTCGGGTTCVVYGQGGRCLSYVSDDVYPCERDVCDERRP